jgi:hypothetical protein
VKQIMAIPIANRQSKKTAYGLFENGHSFTDAYKQMSDRVSRVTVYRWWKEWKQIKQEAA